MIDSGFGCAAVEMRAATKEIVRIEEAENEVGIGDRGLHPAAAIAGGSRDRAGALWTNMQHAAGIDARN